jgi:hypothetical protein
MAARSSRKASRKSGRKTRKLGAKAAKWTAFVKKIYVEMKKKNPNVKLGAAMKEASRRKSEM